MNFICELTAEEKRLIDLVRSIKFGTIQEINVRDGKINIVKVETPAVVLGFKTVESVKLDTQGT